MAVMVAGVAERGRVDAHLVRPGLDDRTGVLDAANAPAHGERDEQLCGHRPDGRLEGPPRLERRRDVEDHELVDPLDVVAPRELGRVARLAQLFEPDALDHASVAHVEARDDSFRQHQVSSCSPTKFRRIASPTSPDFSGWNWIPQTAARSTTAENGCPCVVTATVSSHTGTANEWVK